MKLPLPQTRLVSQRGANEDPLLSSLVWIGANHADRRFPYHPWEGGGGGRGWKRPHKVNALIPCQARFRSNRVEATMKNWAIDCLLGNLRQECLLSFYRVTNDYCLPRSGQAYVSLMLHTFAVMLAVMLPTFGCWGH